VKGLLIGLGIFVGVVLFIGLVIFLAITGTYNGLVAERVQCDTSWSQVETQYQRRMDLIPSLVNATKGYLAHEQKIFSELAEARSHYAGATGDAKVVAQGQLETALSRLMVVVENYPNLKADQTVRDLMYELAGTENRVNVARQRFNEAVQVYNTHVQSFPANLIAGVFGFKEKALYQSVKGAEVAPVVNLELK
jgi:LemA protein